MKWDGSHKDIVTSLACWGHCCPQTNRLKLTCHVFTFCLEFAQLGRGADQDLPPTPPPQASGDMQQLLFCGDKQRRCLQGPSFNRWPKVPVSRDTAVTTQKPSPHSGSPCQIDLISNVLEIDLNQRKMNYVYFPGKRKVSLVMGEENTRDVEKNK